MISVKRQIVLAALVFALGAAVYLNWQFENASGDTLVGEVISTKTGTSSQMTLGEALYVDHEQNGILSGDSTYVSASAEEYFSQARVSRQKTRDEAIEVMQNTIETASDSGLKLEASDGIIKMAKNIETEGRVENLIIAKGFDDCMAYLNGDSANIVVAAPVGGLTAAQVAQIRDIVIAETDVKVAGIKIVPIQ